MPSIVTCPACNRKLNLPDNLLGQQVRCPTCSETFRGDASPPLPAPTPPPAPAPAPQQPAFDLLPPLPDEMPASAPPPLPRTSNPAPPRAPDPAPPIPMAQSCPYCGETLQSASPHCPFCGERLGGSSRNQPPPWEGDRPFRRDWEPHRGTLVLVMGVLSIALMPICFLPSMPLGICAWIMGLSDLRKMRQNEMDPLGESSTQAGWICGMIGTILSVGLFGCCGFTMLAGMVGGP